MATPNYGYEKRQRELAKKLKKEEKLRARTKPRGGEPEAPEDPQLPAPAETDAQGANATNP